MSTDELLAELRDKVPVQDLERPGWQWGRHARVYLSLEATPEGWGAGFMLDDGAELSWAFVEREERDERGSWPGMIYLYCKGATPSEALLNLKALLAKL